MTRLSIYFSLIALLTVSGSVVYSVEKPEIDAKALFEQKCSTCHSSDRPKAKAKTAKEWASTVTHMKQVNGAHLSDEEAKLIVDYLARTQPKYMRAPYTGT